MYVCGGINLTKTFHVKHFGTIGQESDGQKAPRAAKPIPLR